MTLCRVRRAFYLAFFGRPRHAPHADAGLMRRAFLFYSVCRSYTVGLHANLTISTRGLSLELLIHSPVHDMYLCFRGSKLEGRRM
ncbi:hypothetical protein EVAR_61420_1, partial [Eumeta japonica]